LAADLGSPEIMAGNQKRHDRARQKTDLHEPTPVESPRKVVAEHAGPFNQREAIGQ
jgi:hypothetical protein